MTEITSLIAAATALLAVILGPLVTLWVAQKHARISIRSQNRQAWINTLRDTISEFVAISTLGSAIVDAKDMHLKAERLLFLEAKIKLLLNPNERDHKKLIELVTKCRLALADDIKKLTPSDDDSPEKSVSESQGELISVLVPLAQSVLKREWERVKKAE